jgi:phenylacetate-CoA ligase
MPRLKGIVKAVLGVLPPGLRVSPLYRRTKRFLSEAQWWDASAIAAWQLARLGETLHHAYENVPGYRELYRSARIQPTDVRSLGDVRQLPFVTKQLIQDNLATFTSSAIPPRRLRYLTTGGSTGVPFGFFQTTTNTVVERAFIHAGWERAGWRLGSASAVLRGAFVGSADHFSRFNRFDRELMISTYYLSPASFPEYEAIVRNGIKVIQAYPSALTVLSDLVLGAGRTFPDVELLLLGSENLYAWQKAMFARAFPRARVFSWYGHAEQVILAPMCEKSDDFHLWPFYGLTELLNEAGGEVAAGETGELVGTSFWDQATPFIRYKTMDLAVRGPPGCSLCGRQFQLLGGVEGRLQELVVTADGRRISMAAINMHDDIFDRLRQFQFFQETPGSVIFRYVPKSELTQQEAERIRQRLLPKFGPGMDVQLEAVAEIKRTRSGKMRFLEQRLPVKYGDG